MFLIGLVVGIVLILGFEFAYMQYLKYKDKKRKERINKWVEYYKKLSHY